MKNNKVIMSLVLASISAMAAAPAFINNKEKDDIANKDASDEGVTVVEGRKIINLDGDTVAQMDDTVKNDLTKQLDAMLLKKSSIQHISESVSILVDNYGHEDQSLKDEIYKELNFAQSADSTDGGASIGVIGAPTGASTPIVYCHGACHSACHSACHGSRGWR